MKHTELKKKNILIRRNVTISFFPCFTIFSKESKTDYLCLLIVKTDKHITIKRMSTPIDPPIIVPSLLGFFRGNTTFNYN